MEIPDLPHCKLLSTKPNNFPITKLANIIYISGISGIGTQTKPNHLFHKNDVKNPITKVVDLFHKMGMRCYLVSNLNVKGQHTVKSTYGLATSNSSPDIDQSLNHNHILKNVHMTSPSSFDIFTEGMPQFTPYKTKFIKTGASH